MRRALIALALLLGFAAPSVAATRFYFVRHWNAELTQVSPAIDSGWEDSDQMQRGHLFYASQGLSGSPDRINTSSWCCSGTLITLAVNSANQEIDRQYISPPLDAGVVFTSGSTTVKMQAMMDEQSTADNINQCILGIRVIASDGSTVQATLLAVANYGTTTELANTTYGSITAGRNKKCADGDTVTASYTTVAGDYLVVEVGFASTGATDGDPQAYYVGADNNGFNHGSTARSDCPVDETTVNCIAWIEFSNTITSPGEPTPGPTRFYLPATTAADVSPAIQGGWTDTNELLRRRLVKANSGSTTGIGQTVDLGDCDQCYEIDRQYVGEPLAAGQTFTADRTTFKAQAMVKEFDTADNILAAVIGVYLVSDDGATLRCTLLPAEKYNGWQSGAQEMSTTSTNETFSKSTNHIQQTCTTIANDRLVVEIGAQTHSAGATQQFAITYGETASDCDETDHSVTTTCSPWIEFSNNVLLASEATFTPRPAWFGRFLFADPAALVRSLVYRWLN